MPTYYVSTIGNDTNDGLSPSTPWSLEHATDPAGPIASAEGVAVLIMADGVYEVDSELHMSHNRRIFWWGANASGVVDGTLATIRASSSFTPVNRSTVAGQMDTGQPDSNECGWMYLHFDANGIAEEAFSGRRSFYSVAMHCRMTGGTVAGAVGANTRITSCLLENNGGNGCQESQVTFCVARNNTGAGFHVFAASAFNCVAYGNAGHGFSAGLSVVENCVADDNAGNGFEGWNRDTFTRCVATRNGGYGFSDGRPTIGCAYGSGAWANTSGARDTARSPAAISGLNDLIDVGEDPYVDAAAGDYRLKAGSAGVGAGPVDIAGIYPGSNDSIGLWIPQEAGGGSSGSPLGSPFIRV